MFDECNQKTDRPGTFSDSIKSTHLNFHKTYFWSKQLIFIANSRKLYNVLPVYYKLDIFNQLLIALRIYQTSNATEIHLRKIWVTWYMMYIYTDMLVPSTSLKSNNKCCQLYKPFLDLPDTNNRYSAESFPNTKNNSLKDQISCYEETNFEFYFSDFQNDDDIGC